MKLALALLLAVALAPLAAQQPARDLSSREELLTHPDAPELNRRAPFRFTVELDTSQGIILVEVDRAMAPHGVDRFYNLVANGYYDDARFFRVVRGQWAQFGIHSDPRVANAWRQRTIPDDPPGASNTRGTIVFAFAEPNGRTTQVFINLQNNARLDAQGFVPFGRVIEGMDVADSLYAGYGEESGGGMREGQQDTLFLGGNLYLNQAFPELDYIEHAKVAARKRAGR